MATCKYPYTGLYSIVTVDFLLLTALTKHADSSFHSATSCKILADRWYIGVRCLAGVSGRWEEEEGLTRQVNMPCKYYLGGCRLVYYKA